MNFTEYRHAVYFRYGYGIVDKQLPQGPGGGQGSASVDPGKGSAADPYLVRIILGKWTRNSRTFPKVRLGNAFNAYWLAAGSPDVINGSSSTVFVTMP